MKSLILIAAFLVSCLLLHSFANAQDVVTYGVFGNGGAVVGDSSFQLEGTLGQPLIGVVEDVATVNKVGFWYLKAQGLATGVEDQGNLQPTEFRLEPNYPNPFNPSTTVQFALPVRSQVTLRLYDLLGREVATLVDGELESGVHKVVFQAESVASGVYFYRLEAAALPKGSGRRYVETKKLTYLK